MFSRSLTVLVLLLSGCSLFGQSAPAAAELSNQALLDRIQQMEKRILELEDHQRKLEAALSGGASTAAPVLTATAQPMTPIQPVPAQTSSTTASPASMHDHAQMRDETQHYPSLQIRGFGDVDFAATDEKGSTSGFDLGQLVLHLASPLSAKVSYFGELSFTATGQAYDVSVERSIIRYDYDDYFKMSFGKYHNPISYWNETFHHGAWLQTTIARPEMIKFGGTFEPVHFVGLLAEGNIPSGDVGLGYSVGLGNGRSSTLSKAGDAGDINDNRAWVAQIFARPAKLYGLQVGTSFYHDKLTPLPGANFDEWISSAHVAWTKEHPEILAEVSNVHHHDMQTLQNYNSTAFYAQFAYRLPWQENKWKPYYRFEYIHRPNAEPVWDLTGTSSVVDLVGSTVGVRYDITNYAAFKGEYRSTRHGVDEPRVNGAFFQTAFTF
jgi:hypothetical protein